MHLNLTRHTFTEESTIGTLRHLGPTDTFECATLEDCVRPLKIAGITAIPKGTYEVIINWSARFKRLMPLLLNVPGFDGVRIHTGNDAHNTEGCILVGMTVGVNRVGQSRVAYDALFPKLQAAAAIEKILLTIDEER